MRYGQQPLSAKALIIKMKFLLPIAVTSTFVVNVSAYDMDEAMAIYKESQAPQQVTYQEPQSAIQPQPVSQGHSRQYYQQRWLENQAKAAKQPVVQQPQNRPQQPQQKPQQPAPEAEDLFMAANSGNNTLIADLVAQGLNINVANAERETALHMAAARGHYSTVIFLINNGAHVNARTIKNWVPLHHAVRFRHANIANYLMRHGSSAGIRTSDGLSAIDMARNVNNNRMLSVLGAR